MMKFIIKQNCYWNIVKYQRILMLRKEVNLLIFVKITFIFGKVTQINRKNKIKQTFGMKEGNNSFDFVLIFNLWKDFKV